MVQQSYQPSSALMDGIVEEERLQRVYYNNTPKQRPSPSSTSPLLSLGSRSRGRRGGGRGEGEGEGRRDESRADKGRCGNNLDH